MFAQGPAKDITFNRALLGKEHRLGTFPVTRELILAYCRAMGETTPVYNPPGEALVAPPIFCSLFLWGAQRPSIGMEGADPRLMAGLCIEHLAPVRSGDTLEGRITLKSVYIKTGRSGSMAFVVWETSFTNHLGIKVAIVRESFAGKFRKTSHVN